MGADEYLLDNTATEAGGRFHGPDQQLANKIEDGIRALLWARGVDAALGRRLPRLFRAAGLLDVPLSRGRS